MIKVSQLAIYPVKSCAQVSVKSVQSDHFGLHMDRRWMLVDEAGKFLSQRQLPRMCLIKPVLMNAGVQLHAPNMDACEITLDENNVLSSVNVWGDWCSAIDCGDTAATWLSAFLDKKCRLVYFHEDEVRQVDLEYAKQGDRTAFSDGFPFLLLSEASLEDLNIRIQQGNSSQQAIEMRQFRPNIVVSGCEAFAEDDWSKIQIGDMILRVVKPCSRCVIPSIDPNTGIRADEPLQTLKTYRKGVCGQDDKKLYFGQNVIAESIGRFDVGMPVTVLE